MICPAPHTQLLFRCIYLTRLKVIIFNRVREATNMDQGLVQLGEALLDTDYRFKLTEGLEKHR